MSMQTWNEIYSQTYKKMHYNTKYKSGAPRKKTQRYLHQTANDWPDRKELPVEIVFPNVIATVSIVDRMIVCASESVPVVW